MDTSRDQSEKHVILGCMSGTSVDGIDLAILTTDGAASIHAGATLYRPYSDAERAAIKAAFLKRDPDDMTAAAEDAVTDAHIDAITKFKREHDIAFDYIAFHGQTISHDPSQKFTWQIGNAKKIAEHFQIPVIYNFRGHDVEMGGQGAPLLPVYHRALMQSSDVNLPSVVINIGGVSNITYLSNDDLIAFDCGAGNALMDDVVKKYFDQTFDDGGEIAARGACNHDVLNELMSNVYFAAPYPKSLDRNAWDVTKISSLSPEDQVTTLAWFTIEGIARGLAQLPQKPTSLYVTGGGRHNAFLMKNLESRTGIKTYSVDDLGWNGDFMEAQGFAYMGARHLKQLPISFPLTTGAPEPLMGGEIVYPAT